MGIPIDAAINGRLKPTKRGLLKRETVATIGLENTNIDTNTNRNQVRSSLIQSFEQSLSTEQPFQSLAQVFANQFQDQTDTLSASSSNSYESEDDQDQVDVLHSGIAGIRALAEGIIFRETGGLPLEEIETLLLLNAISTQTRRGPEENSIMIGIDFEDLIGADNATATVANGTVAEAGTASIDTSVTHLVSDRTGSSSFNGNEGNWTNTLTNMVYSLSPQLSNIFLVPTRTIRTSNNQETDRLSNEFTIGTIEEQQRIGIIEDSHTPFHRISGYHHAITNRILRERIQALNLSLRQSDIQSLRGHGDSSFRRMYSLGATHNNGFNISGRPISRNTQNRENLIFSTTSTTEGATSSGLLNNHSGHFRPLSLRSRSLYGQRESGEFINRRIRRLGGIGRLVVNPILSGNGLVASSSATEEATNINIIDLLIGGYNEDNVVGDDEQETTIRADTFQNVDDSDNGENTEIDSSGEGQSTEITEINVTHALPIRSSRRRTRDVFEGNKEQPEI